MTALVEFLVVLAVALYAPYHLHSQSGRYTGRHRDPR